MIGVSSQDDSSNIKDIDPSGFQIHPEEIYFHKEKPNGNSHYCICFVNMADSTQITAQIVDGEEIAKYYSIFINAIAAIAKNFGAKVIKNVGDSVIFYFPNTSNSSDKVAFKETIECFTGVIAARDLINKRLTLEDLPDISYRLSADYGQVQIGTSVASGAEDLFGPTVNICAKINHLADKNGIVIGGDLYQVIKRFSFEGEYEFRELRGYSITGLKQLYPVYSVKRRERQDRLLSPPSFPSPSPSSPHDNYLGLSPIIKRQRRQADNKESATSPLANTIESQKRKHNTVMLVDDEPDVLTVFKAILLADGISVEAFSDSYAALQAFARSEPRHHFDLVVLDIRMPSMNGLQLYQRLKAIDPHVKVIFLTALDATEELVSVLDGVSSVDIIRKPIDRKHFLQKVRKSIGEEERDRGRGAGEEEGRGGSGGGRGQSYSRWEANA